MTVEECYSALHGDYADAKSRLMNDRLIEKFMLKFPADDAILILREGVEKKDSTLSFRGAHTLKGVAANLGFEELRKAASDLTEQLRGTTDLADPALYEKVEKAYALVIDTLRKYQNEKEN